MKYIFKSKFSILFTLRESRCHPIFCACPAIADKETADCQGLAVDDYRFTLGCLEAGAPSTFAQLDYKFFANRPDMQKTEKPFIIPIFIPHAGCPHRCIFCDQAAITSEKETLLTAGTLQEKVSAHLRYRSKDRNPVQLAFYGGNFLGQKKAAILALLSEAAHFVRAGRVDGIRFSTRPDTVDQKRLELLKDIPVTTV